MAMTCGGGPKVMLCLRSLHQAQGMDCAVYDCVVLS